MTRSKSPFRKRLAASFTDSDDSTIYPADCRAKLRVPNSDESNPTERTAVSGMHDLDFLQNHTDGS